MLAVRRAPGRSEAAHPPLLSGSLRTPTMSGHAFYEEAVVWDQHGCLPLRPDSSAVEQLALYAESGGDFVFINLGMDSPPPLHTLEVPSAFFKSVLHREQRVPPVRAAPQGAPA